MTKLSRKYPKEIINLWLFKDVADLIREQAYLDGVTVITYVNRIVMQHVVDDLGFKPTELTNKSVEPNE